MQAPRPTSAIDRLQISPSENKRPSTSPSLSSVIQVREQKDSKQKSREAKHKGLDTVGPDPSAAILVDPVSATSSDSFLPASTDIKEKRKLPDLATEPLQKIVQYLSWSEALALITINKAFYRERNAVLIALAEQAQKPMPEILIHAIKSRNKQLTIDLIRHPKIKNWLNMPDTEGRTAGYYALHPMNLPLLAILLCSGLDPEQPVEWRWDPEQPVEMQWDKVIGIIKTFIKQDPLIRKTILALFKAQYGDEYTDLYIDGASVAVWQYQWEKAEQDRLTVEQDRLTSWEKAEQGRLTSIAPVLLQLTEAMVRKDVEIMESFLADTKDGPTSYGLTATLDQQNLIMTALSEKDIGLIEALMIQGIDVRVSAPDILDIAKDWLMNETSNDGIGSAVNIQKCVALVDVLKKHYGEKTFFGSSSLAYWKLQFENHQILFRKTQVYWAVLAKDYQLARELVETGSEFMFDPFSGPILSKFDLTPGTIKPSIFVLLMEDFSVERFLAKKILISTIIDKLIPKNVNLLMRGFSLLHYLAERSHFTDLLEKLCKKSGIEVNIGGGCDYKGTALSFALKRRSFRNAKTLIQYGAKDKSSRLGYVVHSYLSRNSDVFILGESLIGLGEQIFEIAPANTWLKNPKWQHPRYRQYVDKIIQILPRDSVNMEIQISPDREFQNEEEYDSDEDPVVVKSVPLAIWLVKNGCVDLLCPLIPKGINLDIEFDVADENRQPLHTLLLPQEKVLLLQYGAHPKQLGLDLLRHFPLFFDRDTWFKTTLEILIRGIPSKNIPLDGGPLSYWLTFYSKKFNWTEAELAPLVIVMLSKKVDYQMFLSHAKQQKHSLLIRLLKIHEPPAKQEIKARVASSRSSFFAPILDINWISPALNPTPSFTAKHG